MKISARIDGSTYGAILSSRPLLSPPQRAARARAALLPTTHANGSTERCCGLDFVSHPVGAADKTPCPHRGSLGLKIARSPCSAVTSRSARRPLGAAFFTSRAPYSRSWNHTSTASNPSPDPGTSLQDLLAFVDQYELITVEEHLEYLRDPYMRRYAPPTPSTLTVSDRIGVASPAPGDVPRTGDEDQETVARLRAAVLSKLLRPHGTEVESIYDIYLQLPGQRMHYLPARLRHSFLAVLGMTQRKRPKAMLRYFAVVADVKICGYPLTVTEWNTAMSFASRYVGTSTAVEVEAALHLWREMEHEAGIKGNEVTFNILFDVASKAGKFTLAEMTYQEMNARKMPFNRFHHVSLIHFFGLKMLSSGVRAAYREMVLSGEMIDSVVLNCVLVSLIRSGEEHAAERVYERMKASDDRSKIMPDRNYIVQKNVNKVLMMFARFGRQYPESRSRLQRTTMRSPDLQTYRILITHFGVRLGQISKVARYLDEMKFFRVPLHGAIFLALFKSFAMHGGRTGSDWSLQRLEAVWAAMLEALDEGAEGLYISTWLGMWALRAFLSCSKSRDRVIGAYDALAARWDLDATTSEFMVEFLHKLLQKEMSPRHAITRPTRRRP